MSKMKKMFKLGSKKHADPVEWTKSDDKMLAAIQADDLERVEQLMAKKALNPTKLNGQGLTALHVAAMEGRINIIRFFKEKEIDLSATDFYGKAALHCACKAGHAELVRYFLEENPDMLMAMDHNDLTPLHHACLGAQQDIMHHLVQAGASVSTTDKVGRTPLFICARLGKVELCKDMLDHGAEINHRDLDRMTALMFAVEYNHVDVAAYLVKRGANTLLTDAGGRNAMSYAKQAENEEIVDILSNAPSRASWSLDKVESVVEATVVDEADMVAKFEPLEDDIPVRPQRPKAPTRRSKKSERLPPPPVPVVKETVTPPPEFDTADAAQLAKVEHGVVPMDDLPPELENLRDTAATVMGHTPSPSSASSSYTNTPDPVAVDQYDISDKQIEAQFVADTEFSPEAVAAVEEIMMSQEASQSFHTPESSVSKTVDAEEYKELEEEHEYLNRELQQISVEKKQLEEKVVMLERRLSDSESGFPMSSLTAPIDPNNDQPYSTIVELEEELEEARTHILEGQQIREQLQDEVKQLRKQIRLDSKPEADRSADDSWGDSDDDLFELETDKMKASNGAADAAVVASLRSQVLNLERELEEAKTQLKHPSTVLSEDENNLSESATERDLLSLTQYSMLQQAHDAECQQLQSRIDSLTAENIEIKEQLMEPIPTSATVPVKDITNDGNDIKPQYYNTRELADLNDFIESIQKTSSSPSELDEVKQRIQSLQGKIIDNVPVTLSPTEVVRDFEAEKDKLTFLLKESQLENERLNFDLTEIHSQVQGLEGLAAFNTELTNENERLKEEVERLTTAGNSSPREANQRAMAKLTMQLQQENNDLKSENRSLNSQIADIENSLKETIAQKAKERQQGSPLETENNTLKNEIVLLKQSLEEKRELLDAKTSIVELPPDIEELKSQIVHLKRTISQQDETIMELVQQSTRDAQLRHDYETLESESQKMTTKMMEFQTLFAGQGEESKQRIQELEKQIQGLKDENANLLSRYSSPQVCYSSVNTEELQGEIADLKQINKALEKEKKQLEEQVSDVVSQFDLELLKVKKDADRALEKEKDLLEEEKRSLETQLAQLEAASIASEKTSEDMVEANQVAKQEFNRLSDELQKLSQERLALIEENQRVTQERDELMLAIPNLKEEIGKLETQQLQNSTVEKELYALKQENNVLLLDHSNLQKKLSEMETLNLQDAVAYSDLQQKVKGLEDQLETEQSKTVMTIMDRHTSEQRIVENELKDQISQLSSENQDLKEKLEKLGSIKENGNIPEVLVMSAVAIESAISKDDSPRVSQGLGSSLKRRSEEIRFKEMEEENENLKTEVERLKGSETNIEEMKKQLLMVTEKLEVMEQRHREVVTTYRAHLLRAVRGHMDNEVQQALMNIIKIRQAPEVDV